MSKGIRKLAIFASVFSRNLSDASLALRCSRLELRSLGGEASLDCNRNNARFQLTESQDKESS